MSNPFEEFKKQFREDDPVVRFEQSEETRQSQRNAFNNYHASIDKDGNVHMWHGIDFGYGSDKSYGWWDDTKVEYNIYDCSSNLEPIVGAAKYTGYANQKRLEGEVISVKRVERITL